MSQGSNKENGPGWEEKACCSSGPVGVLCLCRIISSSRLRYQKTDYRTARFQDQALRSLLERRTSECASSLRGLALEAVVDVAVSTGSRTRFCG